MFSKEKNTSSADRQSGTSATLISAGTELQGDLNSDNDLRVDGTIHGNITCKAKIIIGPNGYIEGNIESVQADIMGKVTGDILAKELLQLRGQSIVKGNVTAEKLQIEPSAIFNGQCKMSVETMKTDKNAKKEPIELYQ